MKLELTKIDPYNCSLEELEEEISRLKDIKDQYYNLEQAIKVFINSIYGALASPFFSCYNILLAEAVTLQGQDLIKYTGKFFDDYFKNLWHKDFEAHAKLGVKNVSQVLNDSLIIYNDTDSAYATLAPVLDSCQFDCTPLEMIHKINDFVLTDLFDKRLCEYAHKFNTENIQVLELEKISYNVLMIAKKKYILNLAWKDPGVFYNRLEKIKPTGIELVQGSTPKFARKILKDMVYKVMDKGKSLTYAEIVKQLKQYRNEFSIQHPDDISKTLRVGDYEKYVLDDKKKIDLAMKCPFHTKGAALYNHKLYNSNWRTKYNIIKSGDKVKNYYSTDGNSFSYLPNMYPGEFAPPIDFNQQYATVVITPFNKYINALGFRDVPHNLIYSRALF